MKAFLWCVLSAIVLVEVLAFSFRLNFWRRRANAVEHAALSYADTTDERTQEKLVISAALNLLGLVIYVWALLAFFLLFISFIPDLAHIRDSVYLWSTSAAFVAYAWLRATLLERRQQKTNQADQPSVGYNRIARWLHWMALEVGLVRSASFELEKALFLKKATLDPRVVDQPVYVMALRARAQPLRSRFWKKPAPFIRPPTGTCLLCSAPIFGKESRGIHA